MSKSGIEPKASSTAVKSQDQRYVANYKYLISNYNIVIQNRAALSITVQT